MFFYNQFNGTEKLAPTRQCAGYWINIRQDHSSPTYFVWFLLWGNTLKALQLYMSESEITWLYVTEDVMCIWSNCKTAALE